VSGTPERNATPQPALFLDRDGVVNVDCGYVHRKEDIIFIDGIFALARTAHEAGYLVVIVTNQAGIGRGYYDEAQFHDLMAWMREEFRKHGATLDAVYFCPDHPEHGIGKYKRSSEMRKPGPGMLLLAAREHKIDLHSSIMIGDACHDMEAGAAAGIGALLYFGKDACPRGARKISSLAEAEQTLRSRHMSRQNHMKDFPHIRSLLARHPELAPLEPQLYACVSMLSECIRSGGKILTCGNGGSAADAEHIVGELMKSFLCQRPLPTSDVEALENICGREEGRRLAASLEGAIPALSLVSGVALPTAFANDVTAENCFAQQVLGLGNRNDLLWVISTSGNSRNVVQALRVAKMKGLRTIGLTGSAPGAVAPHCDVQLQVPASSTPAIQELHLPVYHALCAELERILFTH